MDSGMKKHAPPYRVTVSIYPGVPVVKSGMDRLLGVILCNHFASTDSFWLLIPTNARNSRYRRRATVKSNRDA